MTNLFLTVLGGWTVQDQYVHRQLSSQGGRDKGLPGVSFTGTNPIYGELHPSQMPHLQISSHWINRYQYMNGAWWWCKHSDRDSTVSEIVFFLVNLSLFSVYCILICLLNF